MVKCSSFWSICWSFSWSCCRVCCLCSSSCSSSSAVVPLFPVVWDSGAGGVSVDKEEKKSAEEVVIVAVGEEVGDAFEGEEPGKGLDNNPEIRQRLRTFHTV